jgi:hypothetical protein
LVNVGRLLGRLGRFVFNIREGLAGAGVRVVARLLMDEGAIGVGVSVMWSVVGGE